MSTNIMNAINAYAKEAAESNRKNGKALASFSSKDGTTNATISAKKELELVEMGVSKVEYLAYANCVKAIYFDAIHLINSKNPINNKSNPETIEKIRSIMHKDVSNFCELIAGQGTKMSDILNFSDFVNMVITRAQDFRANIDGYDMEAARINSFVKWLEAYASNTLSGKAMLSFAERDRRRDLAKWSKKVDSLSKNLENAEKELASTDKADESKIIMLTTNIKELKESLEKAKAKKEEAENRKTDYTSEEFFHEVNAQ